MIGAFLKQIFCHPVGETLESLIDSGNSYADVGDHVAALSCFERALARDPGAAVAHNNLALSLQAVGRIEEAWAEAEWRLTAQPKVREFSARVPIPRWNGQATQGRLLLLWEQGYGDMLQHLRFLPVAAKRAGALAFVCPRPIRRLVNSSFPNVELVAAEERSINWGRYAAYVQLLSLPYVLGTRWSELPAAPYLRGIERARNPSGGVGIVWKSSSFDSARDCALDAMLSLTDLGHPIVSLQVGASDAERAVLAQAGIGDLGSTFSDYLDTGHAIAALDTVVTVDTSVAHLAGGMGCRVLLALSEPAAARWMLHRSDSPWYPTMRLYRKSREESWPALIRELSRDLVGSTRSGLVGGSLQLNLGCGGKHLPGWVNVDKFGSPDLILDLEQVPWPWETGSAREVLMSHVLEHLGQNPITFISVMKELYRVCAHGARVFIVVPHPRHDFFLADPTHVRPIVPATLELFSRRKNEEWQKNGVSNTPLALYHGVDFEIEQNEVLLDSPYRDQLAGGIISQNEAHSLVERYNNIATEIRITLRVVKSD